MEALWPVLLGGLLAIAGGVGSDIVRASRERRHEDRKFWREQSKATYLRVLGIVSSSNRALDAVGTELDRDGMAEAWIDEGAFDAVYDVLRELHLFAPDDIIEMVEQIPVQLNSLDPDGPGPRAYLRRTRDRIREHFGIE